jgi:hypothetical protein
MRIELVCAAVQQRGSNLVHPPGKLTANCSTPYTPKLLQDPVRNIALSDTCLRSNLGLGDAANLAHGLHLAAKICFLDLHLLIIRRQQRALTGRSRPYGCIYRGLRPVRPGSSKPRRRFPTITIMRLPAECGPVLAARHLNAAVLRPAIGVTVASSASGGIEADKLIAAARL